MNFVLGGTKLRGGGISIATPHSRFAEQTLERCAAWFAERGLGGSVLTRVDLLNDRPSVHFELDQERMQEWAPGYDTLDLSQRLELNQSLPEDLEREILIAMLVSPVRFELPSIQELESSIRVRCNIVEAARKTFLSFAAYEAERPEDCWVYDEDRGFLIRPGKSLIDALIKATQPPENGTVYSFSCYRATEYVIALGVAIEAARTNPILYQRLQKQAETRAIRSGEFHRVFMNEYGSRANPLPGRFYVPGDRVWFRNPDYQSSDATGFEGSWVFYLGGGLFTDFWKRNRTFTLHGKFLEMYHWRHATYRDDSNETFIDEKIVQQRIAETLKDPEEVASIIAKMERLQDPKGVYEDGGCIDPSREFPKWVCEGTSDILLPDA